MFIMSIGQICTLAPNLFGTLIILGAAGFYAFVIGFHDFQNWVFISLLGTTIMAEVVARWLRIYLTKNYNISRKYSINTTVCNLVGIIVADVLFGPWVGVTIWELVVGKALFPYFNKVIKILLRLFLIALLRFTCGLLMIIIILKYIMHV
jgi:uncharacterized protein YqgC (DUF456 family)